MNDCSLRHIAMIWLFTLAFIPAAQGGQESERRSNHQLQGIYTNEVPMISGGGLAAGSMRPPEPPHPAVRYSPALPPFVPSPDAPVLSISFEGFDFDDNATENSGFYFIPPDPIAAAGPDRIISVVNVMIEARTKVGVLIFRDALADFFSSLSPPTRTFDPKVIYDQYAGRFVVVTLERVDGAGNPDPGNISRILLAVSKTSSPATATTADWYYHAISSKTVIGGLEYWADYPGFAVDEEAVYITNNMFTFITSSFGGVRLWIVDKGVVGGFYGGGAASVAIYNPYASAGIATTTQPAHVFGAGGVPGPFDGSSIGTFLVSYSGLTDGTDEYVQVVRVDDPLGTPAFVQEYILVGNLEGPAFPALPDAPQSGTATLVEVNDRRALNAVWRSGLLWLATTILPNSGPDVGETTAHWFKLSTAAVPGGAITLSDQGSIGGEDIAAHTYTFFPSIAVNTTGDVAIGFSASAATKYPGAYFTGRFSGDPAGTNRGSGILREGTDYYVRTFGGPRNRWGDYSGTFIDPADDSFWVFNEFAMTRGTAFGGEDGRWRTAGGNFAASALPIQLAYFNGIATSQTTVHLRWGTISELNNYGFEIQKGQLPAAYETIPNSFIPGHGTTIDPQHYEYTDATASPGQWHYRLKQMDLDGTIHYSAGIVVDVLTDIGQDIVVSDFALEQNYPNPFNPLTTISLAVPYATEAKLEVFDLLGRLVATPLAGQLSAGQHNVRFDAGELSSGVYLYRMTAGTFTETRKFVLMR